MSASYTQTLSSDTVLAEIEALIEWHAHILRHCFYPESRTPSLEVKPPSSLLLWSQQQAEKGNVDKKSIEHLTHIHDGLYASARACVEAAKTDVKQYDFLAHHLESYVTHLRRLQRDMADSGGMSVDPVTGLRTASGIRADLQRELDRFERKGTSFSIANIGIDHLDTLQNKYDLQSQNAFYAHLAQRIGQTVRSFDDTYYLGQGEYIIVLKHVGFLDACTVMDRLRMNIETTPVNLENGERVHITASFGVAEALQKETGDVLLKHANEALMQARQRGGNRVHEYKEVSAFAAFVQDADKDLH